jgi:GTP cyclohydrolase IA
MNTKPASQPTLPLGNDLFDSNGHGHGVSVEAMDAIYIDTLTKTLKDVFGNDSWDDSAEDTARRVLKYWREMVPKKEIDFKFTAFPAIANQMIIVKDIEFSSMCAHHLLPFYGVAHVAYLPNKLMVGLSKIPRLVDHFAHRPCTQEGLTASIAEYLKHELAAMGVAVVLESQHTCMACRGVRKHNASMITSEMRGIFLTAEAARAEFMNLIRSR